MAAYSSANGQWTTSSPERALVAKLPSIWQLLVHKAMVIISALASISFHDDGRSPPTVPTPAIAVRTQASGLSFWSSLWLAVAATPLQLFAWYARPRNSAGSCQPQDQLLERELVFDWAVAIDGLAAACRDRIHQSESATYADMDPWHEFCWIAWFSGFVSYMASICW